MLGEHVVDEFLAGSGVMPYKPSKDGKHPFDRLCATVDQKRIFVAEIKTKARRTHYPDTGIDIRHYNTYRTIAEKHNTKVFMFFVDEQLQKIYGNWLNVLDKERMIDVNRRQIKYPLFDRGIVYFPLAHMEPIGELDPMAAERMKRLSVRNHEYPEAEQLPPRQMELF